MKFRRKSTDPVEASAEESATDAVDTSVGPYDVDDLAPDDGIERLDLGALLIEPVAGLEVQLQVDEETEEVKALLLAGPDGALELRAFAAPRNGDLWTELRPRVAAEYAQRGGTATERQGRWGTELVTQVTVQTEDGRTGTQPTRVIGINGARWMLRATLLGRPAHEFDGAELWESAIEKVVVRRGAGAMPVGAELPLTLPPRDQLTPKNA